MEKVRVFIWIGIFSVSLLTTLAYTSNNAVLISHTAPAKDSDRWKDIWNNTFLMWELLYTGGFSNDSIHVLWQEGNDQPEPPRYQASYHGLTKITDNSATKSNVESIFNWLSGEMDSDDFLFCWTLGHGVREGLVSKLILVDGKMSPSEFKQYVNPVSYKHRVFVLTQCYSGGFIDDLKNWETVVITACADTELSFVADNKDTLCNPATENEFLGIWYYHGEFDFHFANSIREKKVYPYDNPPLVDADEDNDDKVSMEEAFIYTFANDSRREKFCSSPWGSETPQYKDLGGIGDGIFLENIKLLSPNGGECFINDENCVITWSVEGKVSSQTLYFSSNGGSSWRKIDDLDGTSRIYGWWIPRSQHSSETCRLKIVACNNIREVWDMNDNYFEIWQFNPYLAGYLIVDGDVKARLNWSWDSGDYTFRRYELYRGSNRIYYTSNPNNTSYIDPSPFNPGETRYYQVKALWYGGNNKSNIIELTAPSYPKPKPPSSPQLFVWNGEEYVDDNSVLPVSPFIEKPCNYMDPYKLMHQLVPKDSLLLLKIEESEDHTYFDKIKLLAITHPEEISIDLIPDGTIVPYRSTLHPTTCVDSLGRDWLSLIIEKDDDFFEGEVGDWLEIEFKGVEQEETLLGVVQSINSQPLILQVKEGGEWEDVHFIYSRKEKSTQLINVSPYLNGHKLRLGLKWLSNHNLDQVFLTEALSDSFFEVEECSLASAIHSRLGEITYFVEELDMEYREIVPGEELTLSFKSPNEVAGDLTRDFVFTSIGYYTPYTKQGIGGIMSCGEGIMSSEESRCSFSQVYPNPFSSSATISYILPQSSRVSLNVYDIAGRLVKTLIDGREMEAGCHSLDFKTKELPSGIYFIKLKVGGLRVTRKIILVK